MDPIAAISLLLSSGVLEVLKMVPGVEEI